ncbi:MAG TPA: hypothetical protein VJH90_00070 [archaeon]|nr:hypothetical protein [archaeon]
MKNFYLFVLAGALMVFIGLTAILTANARSVPTIFGVLVLFCGILTVALAFNLFSRYVPAKAAKMKARPAKKRRR